MPGRTAESGGGYRFGFQGMEHDPEAGQGLYTTLNRELDTRVIRWWSIDPDGDKLPNESPYSSMGNNPIWKTDPDGNIWDIVADVAFIAYDLGEMAYDYATTGKVDPISVAALSADVTCTFIPIATGGGLAVRAGKAGVTAAKTTAKIEVKTATNVAEKAALSKAEQLAKNKAQGAAKEKVVKGQLEKELKSNEELLEQATYKMPDGKKSRPDFTIVNKDDKSIVKMVDSKSGGATKTPNQKALEKTGGTLTGKKAGAYKGSSTSPTKIETR